MLNWVTSPQNSMIKENLKQPNGVSKIFSPLQAASSKERKTSTFQPHQNLTFF